MCVLRWRVRFADLGKDLSQNLHTCLSFVSGLVAAAAAISGSVGAEIGCGCLWWLFLRCLCVVSRWRRSWSVGLVDFKWCSKEYELSEEQDELELDEAGEVDEEFEKEPGEISCCCCW